MGYPVSHSRSPVIHQLFARQTGQQIRYELLQVAPDKLETAVRQFQRTGGKGLNITVPHKQAVMRLADHLSDRATTAGHHGVPASRQPRQLLGIFTESKRGLARIPAYASFRSPSGRTG